MSGILKSQVSWFCEEIDVCVKVFFDWFIEGDWLYVWIDVMYLKVCQVGWIVLVVVIIVVGVNSDGRCEVFGMVIGVLEVEMFWMDFFCGFVWWGLCGVKFIILDVYEGIKVVVLWVFSVMW